MDENKPTNLFELEVSDCEESHAKLKPARVDDLCPKCGKGKLDYDGTLSLACPVCGYKEAGCFT